MPDARRGRPRRLHPRFRPARKKLWRVARRMHRRGELPVGPQSAMEAVVAVHDLLRSEGRPTDPATASRAEIDATVFRAVELRDLIRAGLWPG